MSRNYVKAGGKAKSNTRDKWVREVNDREVQVRTQEQKVANALLRVNKGSESIGKQGCFARLDGTRRLESRLYRRLGSSYKPGAQEPRLRRTAAKSAPAPGTIRGRLHCRDVYTIEDCQMIKTFRHAP
jgi:hypothetical protein